MQKWNPEKTTVSLAIISRFSRRNRQDRDVPSDLKPAKRGISTTTTMARTPRAWHWSCKGIRRMALPAPRAIKRSSLGRKTDTIIGDSSSTRLIHQQIAMVAPTDATVTISGESGTGKEVVARTIHQH